MSAISSKVGGATFKIILQLKTSFVLYDIFAPASEYSLSKKLAPSPAPVSITNLFPCAVSAATASGVKQTRFS